MATLFDNLRDSLSQKGEAPTSKQRQIESGLAAKTGKAAPTAGVLSSRLGEQAAIAGSKQQLTEQETAGRLTGEELVGKEKALAKQEERKLSALQSQKDLEQRGMASKATLEREGRAGAEELAGMELDAKKQQQLFAINTGAESSLREMAATRNIKMDSLFSSFKKSNVELEDRKDAAKLEQVGFLLAMQDQRYLDEINRVGNMKNLKNDISFQEEMNHLVWGQETSLLMNNLDFKWDQDVKDSDFAKQLSKIDIDAALSMANASLQEAQQQAMYEGGGTVLSAGLRYAARDPEDKKKKDTK